MLVLWQKIRENCWRTLLNDLGGQWNLRIRRKVPVLEGCLVFRGALRHFFGKIREYFLGDGFLSADPAMIAALEVFPFCLVGWSWVLSYCILFALEQVMEVRASFTTRNNKTVFKILWILAPRRRTSRSESFMYVLGCVSGLYALVPYLIAKKITRSMVMQTFLRQLLPLDIHGPLKIEVNCLSRSMRQ